MKTPDHIARILDFIRNMGLRYIAYRSWYEIRRKTGLLQRAFPVQPPFQTFITLEQWKALPVHFFFDGKENLHIPKRKSEGLETAFQNFLAGKVQFFSASWFDLGTHYDWVTNPENGYQYPTDVHWTRIKDFSREAGDIKYVWEKSRFSFLYMLIRYDYHHDHDCAELVFREIEHWIRTNPVNQGPNYRCSQEISLRILNWTFALYYYKNHPALTQERFKHIVFTIYWQLKHVRTNIHFSRIAVRNNHALVETLVLYLAGILFPFFPEAAGWKKVGKRWFEEEILYQIYEDGTFLQHTMNYHRVVVQLLSWAFILADRNGEHFADVVYERGRRSLQFLYQCQDAETGQEPHYGHNDGALFFPLNNCIYRDYRGALNALHTFFFKANLYENGPWFEDAEWLNGRPIEASTEGVTRTPRGVYPTGGYYVFRDTDRITFLRCASYRDRPAQADNLHLDLWYKGVNILRDAGLYKYNVDLPVQTRFVGTEAHNTVQLGPHDQMYKGGRFIWFFWTQAQQADVSEDETCFEFTGTIKAFGHIDNNIYHRRTVRMYKHEPRWEVEDELLHSTGLPMHQYWHPAPEVLDRLKISASDKLGRRVDAGHKSGYFAAEYGTKEEVPVICFTTPGNYLITTITIA